MKKLTFAFSCQIDDEENYVPENSIVQVDDSVYRQHEGFTPVIITEALSYTDKPITIDPITIFFMNESFKELR